MLTKIKRHIQSLERERERESITSRNNLGVVNIPKKQINEKYMKLVM